MPEAVPTGSRHSWRRYPGDMSQWNFSTVTRQGTHRRSWTIPTAVCFLRRSQCTRTWILRPCRNSWESLISSLGNCWTRAEISRRFTHSATSCSSRNIRWAWSRLMCIIWTARWMTSAQSCIHQALRDSRRASCLPCATSARMWT